MTLNRICFAICIVCIVIGVTCGIAAVWLPVQSDVVAKAFATTVIVFGGAAATSFISGRETPK